MKRSKLNRAIFLVSLLSLAILASCSKRNNNEPQPDVDVKQKPETSVKGDSTVLLPGATTTFELLSSSTLKDTLNATIAGKPFVLYKIEGNKYGGTIPVIPQGTHEVSIPSLTLKSPVSVSIAAYTPIADPTTIIEGFQSSLSQNIDSLVAFNEENHSIDIEFVKSLEAQIKDMLKNLSPTERIEAAYALKALNVQTGGGLNALNIRGKACCSVQQAIAYPYAAWERPKNVMEEDAGDKLVTVALNMDKAVIVAVIAAPVAIASVAAIRYTIGPARDISALSAVLSIATYIIAREYAITQAQRVAKLEGIAEVIFQPQSQSISQPKVLSTSNALATLLTFKNGVERPIAIPMTFRTVTMQDAQSPSNIIARVVKGDNELLVTDKKVEAGYNSITKYLPFVKAYKKYFLQILTAAKRADRNAPAANLSVTKVSDPEIKLNVVKNGDLLKITATSSTIKSAKDFTFDVTYRNEGLNISLTKTFSAVFDGTAETMTDIDGNVYATIKIGEMIWTKTNLRTTHYNNGDPIARSTNLQAWLTGGAYHATNVNAYGLLYNTFAVLDGRGIAPKGWHIATDAEWGALINASKNISSLKSTSSDWKGTNKGAEDEFGFSALPVGYADLSTNKDFVTTKWDGQWAAFFFVTGKAASPVSFEALTINGGISSFGGLRTEGAPVRCVKDR